MRSHITWAVHSGAFVERSEYALPSEIHCLAADEYVCLHFGAHLSAAFGCSCYWFQDRCTDGLTGAIMGQRRPMGLYALSRSVVSFLPFYIL